MMDRFSGEPLRAFSLPAAAARLRIAELQVARLVEQGSLTGFHDESDRLMVLLPVEPEAQRPGGRQERQTAEPQEDPKGRVGEQGLDLETEFGADAASQTSGGKPGSPPTSTAPPWALLKEAFEAHCQLVERLLDKVAPYGREPVAETPAAETPVIERPALSDAAVASQGAGDRISRLLEDLSRRVERLERSHALQEQDLDSLLEIMQLIRDHLDRAPAAGRTPT